MSVQVAYIGTDEVLGSLVQYETGECFGEGVGLAILSGATVKLPAAGLRFSVDVSRLDAKASVQASVLQVSSVFDDGGRSSLTATVADRSGRYCGLVLKGTLADGVNLIQLSQNKHDNRRLVRARSGSGLPQDVATSVSFATGLPDIEPVAGWNLPRPTVREIADELAVGTALEGDTTECQNAWLATGPLNAKEGESLAWALRVQWLGAPAIVVEEGSWSPWNGKGSTTDTWTGQFQVPDSRSGQLLQFWMYRRQQRATTVWTITGQQSDVEDRSGVAGEPVNQLLRQVTSVCVQTSGMCGVLGPR